LFIISPTLQEQYKLILNVQIYKERSCKSKIIICTDATDYVIARDVFTRDPEFMLEILSKMKSGVARPMEK